MSCYLRHIKDILDEAGIEEIKENKKHIDSAVYGIVAPHGKLSSVTCCPTRPER
ncbi:MAG: hypothetical protein U9N44_03205 [Chloroflexota bacterium]|nr:hypothetical protein [Chloroflexota bacterium]